MTSEICATILLVLVNMNDPAPNNFRGAVWNQSGTWTVDWPVVERYIAHPPDLTIPKDTPGVLHLGVEQKDFTLIVFKALLNARDDGKLLEGTKPKECMP